MIVVDSEEEGNAADYSDVDTDRSAPAAMEHGFVRKKRGRPTTTGDYAFEQEHRKQVAEFIENEKLEQVKDRFVKAKVTACSKKVTQPEAFANEFCSKEPAYICTTIIDCMESVRKVAEKSSNLKGGYKTELWRAANAAEGAMTAMLSRIEKDTAMNEIRQRMRP